MGRGRGVRGLTISSYRVDSLTHSCILCVFICIYLYIFVPLLLNVYTMMHLHSTIINIVKRCFGLYFLAYYDEY